MRLAYADDLLSAVTWVFPDRPLTKEYEVALQQEYLRGADLWHVACALNLESQLGEIAFVSLDEQQASVATALGLATEDM